LDSLSGKAETEGLTVTFHDGTVTEQFLSWKSFRQLLALKTAQVGKATGPKAVQAVVAPPSANAVAVK
jgi:hypothetical protein